MLQVLLLGSGALRRNSVVSGSFAAAASCCYCECCCCGVAENLFVSFDKHVATPQIIASLALQKVLLEQSNGMIFVYIYLFYLSGTENNDF